MKQLVALLTTLLMVLGLSSVALAQVEPEVEVEVEGEGEPEPGDTVTINTSNLDPDTEVSVTLGDNSGTGVADADGIASVDIVLPDSPGEIDGIVNVNGVDVPFSVLVAAAAADGTPVPSGVAAGDGSGGSDNSRLLFAIAAGLLVLSGGALTLSRIQPGRFSR